jgi:hypothetical protein
MTPITGSPGLRKPQDTRLYHTLQMDDTGETVPVTVVDKYPLAETHL